MTEIDGDLWYLWFKDNNFYIYGDILDSFPEKIIIPFMEEMKRQSLNKLATIKIYINSWWWYVTYAKELIALIDQCKNNQIAVVTIVPDIVASAASMIAIAWHIRIVWRHATHIIHNPRWTDFASTEKQLENNTDAYKQILKRTIEHYQNHTKIKDLKEKLDEDNHRIYGWKNLIKQWLADLILEETNI